MKKQKISDLDHFYICKLIKDKNINELKEMADMLKSEGYKKGFLISDADVISSKKIKKPIKFPFVIDGVEIK